MTGRDRHSPGNGSEEGFAGKGGDKVLEVEGLEIGGVLKAAGAESGLGEGGHRGGAGAFADEAGCGVGGGIGGDGDGGGNGSVDGRRGV